MTRRLIVCLVMILCGGGCLPWRPAPAVLEETGWQVVEGVPFRLQEQADDCGPAGLSTLLAHRGRELPVAEIARVVTEPKLGGSLLQDLENFARHQGFTTRSGRGDLARLRLFLASGHPVLIPIDAGTWPFSRPHYLVLYGFAPQHFLAHAGTTERVVIEATELERRWSKLNRLYLYLE